MAATDNTPDRDPQSYLFGDHDPQRVMDAMDRFLVQQESSRNTRTDDEN